MASEAYRYLRCEEGGQINRLPEEKFESGLPPKCGQCKAPLSLKPHPVEVTDKNFQDFITGPVPALVDFWAPWCGPCHALAPTIEQIAQEYAGQITVGKVNTDENPVTAFRFQIRGIPAVLLFNKGREESRLVGVQPKSEIARRIQALLR